MLGRPRTYCSTFIKVRVDDHVNICTYLGSHFPQKKEEGRGLTHPVKTEVLVEWTGDITPVAQEAIQSQYHKVPFNFYYLFICRARLDDNRFNIRGSSGAKQT